MHIKCTNHSLGAWDLPLLHSTPFFLTKINGTTHWPLSQEQPSRPTGPREGERSPPIGLRPPNSRTFPPPVKPGRRSWRRVGVPSRHCPLDSSFNTLVPLIGSFFKIFFRLNFYSMFHSKRLSSAVAPLSFPFRWWLSILHRLKSVSITNHLGLIIVIFIK